MEIRKEKFGLSYVALLCLWTFACGLLSPKCVNFEVLALMGIKSFLVDPRGVLDNWDDDAVDPCSWNMVTCSNDGLVISLGAPSQNLSGIFAPSIGNLTNLQLLFDNNISGNIPSELGRPPKLNTLDVSNFSGQIPTTLSYLENLQYLRLNNNSLSGTIPSSLANKAQLTFLDLSFNNLSSQIPGLLAKSFNIVGNPLICAAGAEQVCSRTRPMSMSISFNNSQRIDNVALLKYSYPLHIQTWIRRYDPLKTL